MVLIRAQKGNYIVDFITADDGTLHINMICGDHISRRSLTKPTMGERLYKVCKNEGYEICTWINYQKVTKNPTHAFERRA